MLSYFNKYQQGQYRTLLAHPRWSVVNQNTKINIENIIQYCRSVEGHGGYFVNPLTKIIDNLSDGIQLSEFEYYKSLLGRAMGIAYRNGCTCERGMGEIHKDFFYLDSYSVIQYVEKPIDLSVIDKYWKIMSPLRVLYSVDSDMDYEARERKKSLPGVAIYELDVIRLMLLYRRWSQLRINSGKPIKPNIFLTQIVFPNMLLESVNINLFNRFKNLVRYGKDFKENPRPKNYPFYYLNVDSYIDKELREFYGEFNNRSALYGRIINSLPDFQITPHKPNEMLFYLRTNVPMNHIQVSWVLWCSRLPYMRYLLEFLGERGFKFNRDLYVSFQKEFLQFRTRGYRLHPGLPEDFKDEMKDHIEYIRLFVFPNLK